MRKKIIDDLSEEEYSSEELSEIDKITEETENNKHFSLVMNSYWVGDEWIQPPVKIKHGDLVEVKCEGYLGELLGRYIGKGYGVVELYNYSTGIKYVVGKVITRGFNRNPRLISDENLFEFIKD